jgi:hypothetical protein
MVPVNSNIPLAVQAPNIISPLQLQQQRLTLQNLANANAIQQQAQHENALKIQAQQEDQNDQSTFQNALKNHTSITNGVPTTDWDAALAEASPNMRIRNVQAIQSTHYAILKNAAEASDAQRLQWTNNNTAIGRALSSVYQAPEDQKLPVYQQARQDLISQGVVKPDDPRFPEVPTKLDNPTLEAEMQGVGYLGTMLQQAKEQATTAATLAATKTSTAKATRALATQEYEALGPNPDPLKLQALQAKYGKDLEIPGLDATPEQRDAFIGAAVDPKDLPDYLLKSAQARAYAQMKPDDWLKQVDAVLPPSGDSAALNATAKADIQNSLAMKASGPQIEAKIDKAVQQLNEQRKAVAVAEKTVPFKVDVGAGIANANQGIRSRISAQPDYLNAMKEYEQSQSVADIMGRLAQAAQDGNKAAGQGLQTAAQEGLNSFQNIRRLGGGQLGNLPGSFLDKIEGHLNNFAHGTGEFTPEVADDLVKTQQTLADEALNRTKNNIQDINSGLAKGAQPFPNPTPRVPGNYKLRTDIPAALGAQIPEGGQKIVHPPGRTDTITLVKKNGEIYEVGRY